MKSNKYRVRGCLSTSFPLSYIPGSSNCAEFSFAFSSITPSKFGRYFAQLEGLGINQFQFGKDPVTELLTYKSNTYYISTPSTFMSGSPGWKPLHYHPGPPDRTPRKKVQVCWSTLKTLPSGSWRSSALNAGASDAPPNASSGATGLWDGGKPAATTTTSAGRSWGPGHPGATSSM